MTIEVERAPDAPGDEAYCVGKAAELQHHIKSTIGVTCRVVVKAPCEMPRSQGKAVRVRDLRRE